MTRDQWSKLSKTQDEQILKGTMKHSEAMKLGETLGKKIDRLAKSPSGTRVDKEVAEINSIINHIAGRTDDMKGWGPSKLFEGSVSSVYDNRAVNASERVYGEVNKGISDNAFANTVGNKVTFNLQNWGSKDIAGVKNSLTVANIQNTYVHEAGGHMYNGWLTRAEHINAVKLQMNHSSFKSTTTGFQQWIKNLYDEYANKK